MSFLFLYLHFLELSFVNICCFCIRRIFILGSVMAFLHTSLQLSICDKFCYNIQKYMGNPWALTQRAFRENMLLKNFSLCSLESISNLPFAKQGNF